MGTLRILIRGEPWFKFIGTEESISHVMALGEEDKKGMWAYSEARLRDVVRGRPSAARDTDEVSAERASLVYCILQKTAREKDETDGLLADYLMQQDVDANIIPVGSEGNYNLDLLIYRSAP
jgi:hypothetical protein